MPDLDRIAVLSDVHGNLTAYQAVLADIEARGITRVVSLGDHIGKGPRGSACVALTQQRCQAAVQGNWEAFLTRPGDELSPARGGGTTSSRTTTSPGSPLCPSATTSC